MTDVVYSKMKQSTAVKKKMNELRLTLSAQANVTNLKQMHNDSIYRKFKNMRTKQQNVQRHAHMIKLEGALSTKFRIS